MVVAQSSPTPTAGDDTRELRRQALRCGGTKCRTITLNVRSPTSGAGRTETADGGLIVAVCVCVEDIQAVVSQTIVLGQIGQMCLFSAVYRTRSNLGEGWGWGLGNVRPLQRRATGLGGLVDWTLALPAGSSGCRTPPWRR